MSRTSLAFDELLAALIEEGCSDYLIDDVRILMRRHENFW